ncbi:MULTISPECIES: GvpL/GvpF family gas vesicle protein [Streptomyces]|uniref:GvpL/GvpF family gas vesicle protein n=1 Tax=Streptomyces yangpuensis TaxID=1648182 RepID=A0ABY5PPG0_9ACTN|nr:MULTISPECIES: GvpL/GvpF family gas vesicle protein [Streptomyces]MBZ9593804.1 GvpL/GvpF family gas vesicle protein [Streptomyces erythrochromogenes]UUY45874.1 GvpL/GvpF family gas vesicle protein [Streptomyces yangpuensis]
MALYVYSIAAEDHPRDLDGLTGVGSSPSPLRSVTAGSLSAVVSDVSEEIRPKRRDLLAHQEVQEQLMADGPILPLQFGYIAADDSAVRQVLETNADGYLDALRRLEGCAEYNVRVAQDDEEPLLQQILRDFPEAAELNERIRAGDADPQLPLALGELVAREVEARQQSLSAGLVQALLPFARDHVTHPPTGNDFLNLSLLVPDEQKEDLLTAHTNLSREIGGGIGLRFAGPLPPYSFV